MRVHPVMTKSPRREEIVGREIQEKNRGGDALGVIDKGR